MLFCSLSAFKVLLTQTMMMLGQHYKFDVDLLCHFLDELD